ncbi:MAG: hypothetical protein U9O94_00720 [Nanoarchaeota archaeon]|nr:hypothetical protein [Nanoarchaeota archaeon]
MADKKISEYTGNIAGNNITLTGSVSLDITSTVDALKGEMRWDNDKENFVFGVDASSVPLNQPFWYVKNQTGGTLTKGTPVYASGTLGASGRIVVDKMIADGSIQSRFFLGVILENVLDGADGIAITQADIRGIDTTGQNGETWNEGDTLYVSDTVAGTFTNVQPTAPHLKLPTAFIIYSNVSGSLAVRIEQRTGLGGLHNVNNVSLVNNDGLLYNSTTERWENRAIDATDVEYNTSTVSDELDKINAIHTDTQEPNGFLREFPETMGDISFVDLTRTFSIAPQAGQTTFDYYVQGVKTQEETTKNIVISDVTGLHIIYFDENGDLQEATGLTNDILLKYAIVSVVYWNATDGANVVFADERHGCQMDGFTHWYNHTTFGARYKSGLALNGVIAGNATYTGSEAGVILDEDIINNIDAQTDAEYWYLDGLYWTKDTATSTLAKITATRPNYNEFTGGLWQQTEIGNNNFCLVHFLATNNNSSKVVMVQGQNEYTKIGDARAGANEEISNLILAGMPTPEFVFVATIILDDNGVVVINDLGETWIDWTKSGVASGSAPSSHINLSDKAIDGHPASVIIPDTINFTNNLSIADDTVQKALDTLDDLILGTVNETDSFLLDRANHTGTQTASTISDFDTGVSNNSSVVLNTAKVSADGTVDTHSDVDTAGKIDGQVMTFNSTSGNWEAVSPASGVTDHTLLSNIGTNTHSQIDTDLLRLLNTSGANTGDQDISGIAINATDIDNIEAKTDFITVTQNVNLDTMESDIAINNAKVSNATHTGEVTGDTALTIADNAITNVKMADDAIGIAELSATGTASDTTYLRGDNTWGVVSGGSSVWIQGTGVIYLATLTDNVGMGIATPTARTHIKGSGNTSATYSVKIEDSDGKPILYARDDRKVGVGIEPTNLFDVGIITGEDDAIPAMTSNTTPYGIASSTTFPTDAWKAFDDNDTSAFGGFDATYPKELAYQFVETKAIVKYTLRSGSAWETQMPADFTFEGWDGSSWVLLDTQTAQTFTINEVKTYTIANTTEYLKYRLLVNSVGDAGSLMRIYGMEMFEALETVKLLTVDEDTRYAGIGIETPKSKLDVDGGVKIGDDTDLASADKVGTIRYRADANNSYAEMCMESASGVYEWTIISSHTW